MISRRQFLFSAGATAVLPFSRTGNQPMTSELIGTLNEGDVLRVVHPAVWIDRATPPPQANFTFAWLTDVHVGRPNTYNTGELQTIVNHILAQNPNCVIVTGDDSENGTDEQLVEYAALWPVETAVFHEPGNHDEPKEHTDPPPNDYTNYIAHINQFSWAFTVGNYRLIGFTSHLKRDEPFLHMAYLDEFTKTFLDGEAAALNGKIPLLFTHFPLHDEYGNNIRDYQGVGVQSGQKNIFDLFTAAGGGIIFTGHRHVGYVRHDSQVVPGLVEIQGPCLSYNTTNDTGYMMVTLTDTAVVIKRHLGRSPFTELETITI